MKSIINSFLLLTFLALNANLIAQTKKWTLEECVTYALQNNISIKQSELDLKTSEIEKNEALGGFLPNINANANYSVNTGANINPATNQFENETFKSFSASANANVPIFAGLNNWKTLQRAKLNKIANEFRLSKMKDDISLTIANSYLQILFNKEQIKIITNQLAITEKNIVQTQKLIDAGVLPTGDIFELKATQSNQEQQKIAAENTLLLAKLSLCQTLLLKDYASFDIANEEYPVPISEVFNAKPEEIALKAKEVVNDIKIASANFEVAKKDISLAKAAYFPTLNGFLGYNTRWSQNPNLAFNEQIYLFDGTNFGVQLNVPVLNGFSVKNRVARSKINAERAQVLLQQATLDLERNVYQAYSDLNNARKTFEAAQKTLEARKQANTFSKARYEIGLLNAFDYAQTQVAFENAQTEVNRTKYDYIFRTKILEFYFGIPLAKNNN